MGDSVDPQCPHGPPFFAPITLEWKIQTISDALERAATASPAAEDA